MPYVWCLICSGRFWWLMMHDVLRTVEPWCGAWGCAFLYFDASYVMFWLDPWKLMGIGRSMLIWFQWSMCDKIPAVDPWILMGIERSVLICFECSTCHVWYVVESFIWWENNRSVLIQCWRHDVVSGVIPSILTGKFLDFGLLVPRALCYWECVDMNFIVCACKAMSWKWTRLCT